MKKNFIIIAIIILTTFLAIVEISKASNIGVGVSVMTVMICDTTCYSPNGGKVIEIRDGNIVTYIAQP